MLKFCCFCVEIIARKVEKATYSHTEYYVTLHTVYVAFYVRKREFTYRKREITTV